MTSVPAVYQPGPRAGIHCRLYNGGDNSPPVSCRRGGDADTACSVFSTVSSPRLTKWQQIILLTLFPCQLSQESWTPPPPPPPGGNQVLGRWKEVNV